MKQEFQILEVINKQHNLNQKKIAGLCGISVGKVNYIINDLMENGYIYSEKSGKNISYYLNEKGIEFLKQGIAQYQDKKINLHSEPHKKITQAVILAAGYRKQFDTPACLLPIQDETLLARNLKILHKNGIEKVIIVTGYKKEAFQHLNYNNMYFVENPKYKWTGSMASLAYAHEFVTDDFLLIEDDVLIEESAIERIIQNEHRDCMLITNESDSGDEAFVEIRNGYIYKISKDIHQFNRIDGEMIGVSKLSYDVFSRMVKEFKSNKNPYLNYEYLLLDVARQYHIGYLKIPDLVWAEIDTKKHYYSVLNNIYPRLKRKEAIFKENQIKEHVMEALYVSAEDIQTIEPFGGMTNKNFKINVSGKEYVLRIPGNGTEQMINRMDEKINSTLASSLGIDTQLAYFNEYTGIKIAELILHAETLNSKTAKREDNMQLIASVLQKLHHSHEVMNNEFNVFEKMTEYEQLLEEANGKNFDDYVVVKDQILSIKAIYENMNISLTPCHNDLVPENLVKSGEDTVYLIDWEYSGMNDPMFDLAALSLECGFSPEDEELFLTIYFNGEAPEEFKTRILINKICQDFLWSIWANIKEAKGDDFGTYGIDRYNRAKENLKLFF
ncbi:NTP transferase domain-containing protein [Microbacteriaceae bacterium 4G12]